MTKGALTMSHGEIGNEFDSHKILREDDVLEGYSSAVESKCPIIDREALGDKSAPTMEREPETKFEVKSKPKSKLKSQLSSSERKRSLLQHTPPKVFRNMELWVEEVMAKLDPNRGECECWIHPDPPSGRYRQTIHKQFRWRDKSGISSATLALGVVTLFLCDSITNDQLEGIITEKWHLSHLCGNWTCCNYHHMTIEPGPTNISRNPCFRRDSPCSHVPQCMREKKLPGHRLLPDNTSLCENLIDRINRLWEGKLENFNDTDDETDMDHAENTNEFSSDGADKYADEEEYSESSSPSTQGPNRGFKEALVDYFDV